MLVAGFIASDAFKALIALVFFMSLAEAEAASNFG
jgi:hypothetical protein